MTATRCVLLVARRELIERARSPMFVASMIITVLIVGVALIVPLMFQDNARKVGLVDAPDPVLAERVAAEAARAGLDVEVRMYGDVSSAEAAVAAGDVDAAVIADREVVWNAEPDLGLDAAITAALFETTVSSRAADLGVDPDTAAALVAPPDVTSRSLEAVDPDAQGRRAVAMIAMVLLFMAIAMYGSFVLTGVVEEKSSRVVEVLLARIRPRHLLAGKILGIGALGLAQVTVLATVGAVALRVSGWGELDVPTVSPGLLGWLVVWFVLGYTFYSTAYGALGALASRTEDAQSGTGPVTFTLLAAYFLVFTTVAGGPEWVVRVLTLVPLTAPMAVPMRAAAGELAWWEAVAALLLMGVAIYGMVRFAGRVYTGAVLRTGAKVRLREAWGSSR